jgi:hypothetical protein
MMLDGLKHPASIQMFGSFSLGMKLYLTLRACIARPAQTNFDEIKRKIERSLSIVVTWWVS